MFGWIWFWWWLATTFGLKICSWYLHIRKIFPGDNDVVGQTGSILRWCRPEIECRKNCVDHNRGSTTTVLDYLDWSRDQGKGKESGHKWLGCMLSSAGSKSGTLDIDYHLQSADRAFFATNRYFWAEMCPSETNWNFSMPSWHQLLVLELGPGASMLPIWINLISTSDLWSDAWLELQPGFAGMIHGTKFCIFGISVCEKWLRYATWKRELKPAHLNNGNLLGILWAFHPDRWVRQMLHWQPIGRGPVGRPAMNWTSKFEQFSRIKRWDDWKNVATDADHWMMEMDELVKFCRK